MRRLNYILPTALIFLGLAALGGCDDEKTRPSETNVVYGEVDGQKLLLDVHLPGGKRVDPKGTLRPAMVLLHGGGWKMGSKADFHEAAALLASRGVVAFSVEYRLI